MKAKNIYNSIWALTHYDWEKLAWILVKNILLPPILELISEY